MKSYATILVCVGSLCSISTGSVHAQGTIAFNNRNQNVLLDAPVSFLDGSLVGAPFRAQLFGGPVGTAVDQLLPLFPITTFPRLSPYRPGYINPVVVVTPDMAPEEKITLVMRAFDGASWETSSCRGESLPIVITLGGGTGPPAPLAGLQPFSLDCIPEPGTLALCGLGAAGWCLTRWANRALKN